MYVIIYIKVEYDKLVYYFETYQNNIFVSEAYVKMFIGDIGDADVVTDDGMLIRTTPTIMFTDDSISCVAIIKDGAVGTHLIVEIKEGYEDRFNLIHKYVSLSDESLNNIISKIRTELRDNLIDKLV